MTPLKTPFFGYHMPSFSFPGATDETRFEQLVALACAAEDAGFDMVTVMDHFYQIGVHGSQEEPMLEAYATLSALAARTSRVMLGTMVSGVTYRNPALLAKTVTTLDTISSGRAILGSRFRQLVPAMVQSGGLALLLGARAAQGAGTPAR